jgi:hypothetical protein
MKYYTGNIFGMGRNSCIALLFNFLPPIITAIIARIFPEPNNSIFYLTLITIVIIIVNVAFEIKRKELKVIHTIIPLAFAGLFIIYIQTALDWKSKTDYIYLAGIAGYWLGILYVYGFHKNIINIDKIVKNQQAINERNTQTLSELSKWTEREDIAFSATCFAFKNDTNHPNEAELALIFNSNFNWWLAPGGHVDVRDGQIPENIARERALSETCLEVELISPHQFIGIDDESCKSQVPPQAVYMLTINENAQCRKMKHHKKHYDFSYIAKVIREVENEQTKNPPLVWVHLKKEITRDDVNSSVENALAKFYQNKEKKKPATPYPHDFIDRIHQAANTYWQVIHND